MKLGQIRWNNHVTAAIFEKGGARPIPEYTMADLIVRSEKEGESLSQVAGRLAAAHAEPCAPILPLSPREVWACGCTYETSASFRDAEHGTREGFYAHVYKGDRPEIFFKGTARVCVGPGQNIGLRPDAKFTAPEPELAVILGQKGRVLGYTLANDVSAWDIERQNPLYLPQSKIYAGACALGPAIVTADEISSVADLTMTCRIERGSETVYSGETSTSRLNRTIEKLIEFLLLANPVPAASVLLTGTGIIVPETAALLPGDVVKINLAQIGELVNTAAVVH